MSLDKLIEDRVPLQKLGIEPIESAEDSVVELEDKAERFRQLQKLPNLLLALSDEDRKLIEALYFKGISSREYGRLIGISQRAVIKRRDRILKFLKNNIKNF